MRELLGTWVAALLTLMVFSYLISDNPLYRLAEHLFIGSALGYAIVVAIQDVLLPRLFTPLARDPVAYWHLLIPLLLGLLLLAKGRISTAWLGNISVGFLFGVGAALAIGGALVGSLLYQVRDTMLPLLPGKGDGGSAIDNLILVVGTLGSLAYFYFTAGGERETTGLRYSALRLGSVVGKWFIMITLGALFANAVIARISLLVGRLQFLLGDWLGIL
ncbi:MAG: hypothetical protein WBH57_02430 [Anaerolineae bacterium]